MYKRREMFLKRVWGFRTTLVFFVFLLILSGSVYPFNFEDYEWGRPRAEIEGAVKGRGKAIIPAGSKTNILYTDVILEENCTVTLIFTPSSKLLAAVKIFWNDNTIGEDVKDLLLRKYGDFYQPNVFVDEYYWQGTSEYDVIVLEYGYVGTTLTYFGGPYQQMYEEESRELIESEMDRF